VLQDESARWRIAIPNLDTGSDLSAFHHLRLAAPDPEHTLERALTEDERIKIAYRPAILYPLQSPADRREFRDQWGLQACHFPDVWEDLDPADGDIEPPIAVIDQGDRGNHADLADRFLKYVPPSGDPGSDLIHAVEVAGIIAAIRGNRLGVAGCCSARLNLYNVYKADDEYDSKAACDALKAVATSDAQVVNISLGTVVNDVLYEAEIARCINAGVVVVAGMGNLGDETPVFPAAYPGVIAVGATDLGDQWMALSSVGPHIWISAPGESVETVFEKAVVGTSYATPMVAAAVWLALKNRPDLRNPLGPQVTNKVKDLLKQSVAVPNAPPNDKIGYGRLDMLNLKKALGPLIHA
jgi:hypothetical protein